MRSIIVLAFIVCLTGCAAERDEVKAPTAKFRRIVEKKLVVGPDGKMVLNPDGTPQTIEVVTIEAEGTGMGAIGEGVKAIKAGEPPTAGPQGSTGGKGSLKWFDVGSPTVNPMWLLIIGAVVIVGGAVLGYFLGWQLGAMVAGAGVCLLAVAWYPWLLLVVALLGLAFVAYLVYKYVKAANEAETATADADAKTTALGVVVKAVEAAGAKAKEVKEAVKDEVKSALAKVAEVTATINAAKV